MNSSESLKKRLPDLNNHLNTKFSLGNLDSFFSGDKTEENLVFFSRVLAEIDGLHSKVQKLVPKVLPLETGKAAIFQDYIFQKISETPGNFGVELPFGSGEDLIQVLLLEHYLKNKPENSVFFLASGTNLLAESRRAGLTPVLQEKLADPKKSVKENLENGKRIFVDTPQKISLELEKGSFSSYVVPLLLLDELHKGSKVKTGAYPSFSLAEKITQHKGKVVGFSSHLGAKEFFEEKLEIKNFISWKDPQVYSSLQYYLPPTLEEKEEVFLPPNHEALVEKFKNLISQKFSKIKKFNLPYLSPKDGEVLYFSRKKFDFLLSKLKEIKNGKIPNGISKEAWKKVLTLGKKDLELLYQDFQEFFYLTQDFQQLLGESYGPFKEKLEKAQERLIPKRLQADLGEEVFSGAGKTAENISTYLEILKKNGSLEGIDLWSEREKYLNKAEDYKKNLNSIKNHPNLIFLTKNLISYLENLSLACVFLEKAAKAASENSFQELFSSLEKSRGFFLEAQEAISLQKKESQERQSEKFGKSEKYDSSLDEKLLGEPLIIELYREIRELERQKILHPKIEKLLEILESAKKEKQTALVVVERKATLKEIKETLEEKGFKVTQLSGGSGKLEEVKRKKTFEWLKKGDLDLCLATSTSNKWLSFPVDLQIDFSISENFETDCEKSRKVKKRVFLVTQGGTGRDEIRFLNLTRQKQRQKPGQNKNALKEDLFYARTLKRHLKGISLF